MYILKALLIDIYFIFSIPLNISYINNIIILLEKYRIKLEII